jgi:dGTPase
MQTDSREREYFFEKVFARHEALKNTAILEARSELEGAFTEVSRLFPPMQEYRGTIKQRTSLRNFTGSLIGRYINGVSFTNQDDLTRVMVEQQLKNEVTMLKELIWIYVIQDPALATQQLGQRHMIKFLFETYVNAAQSRKDWRVFPTYYQERLENEEDTHEKTRTCIDLIAGMTETQVHKIYGRLTGVSTESSLNDPLR